VTVSASLPQYWHERPDFPSGPVQVVPWGWDLSRRSDVGFVGKVIHRVRKVMLPRHVYFPLVRDALLGKGKKWYLEKLINPAFLEALKQADLVLSTGGHHVTTMFVKDAASPQLFDMAVALLYGKPLVLWSQSIGPFAFESDKARQMVRRILIEAQQIYIRDEGSIEAMRQLDVPQEHVRQTRESVFGLRPVVRVDKSPAERPPVMGMAVYVYVRDNPLRSSERYAEYFAPLVDHAIERGYSVRFFPMELAGTDRACIEAVISKVKNRQNCEIVEHFPGTAEHLNAVAQCRMFVGHKTHSQVFALVACTPLLAVAYHPKTKDFMAQFGLSEYCLDDQRITAAELIAGFDRVNRDLQEIWRKQQQVGARLAEQVQADFAQMIERFNSSSG